MQKGDDKTRWVFSFKEGDSSRRDLLGGKGAELAEMTSLGLPVAPGFTITTQACREFNRTGEVMPPGLWDEIGSALKELEGDAGRGFGNKSDPLLVSVRSGAAVSMPGMMDTILNLGINDGIVEGIARNTDERFALDLHRRFIQMFGSVVLGIANSRFEALTNARRASAGLALSGQLSAEDLAEIVPQFKALIREAAGRDIPSDPLEQLEMAVLAVFKSWNGRRAIDYRNFHRISHDLCTAVSVVAMVYGNADDDSCTGVLFTRDPSTGAKGLYGEYLTNAQGEDVVSGAATPRNFASLAGEMPEIHESLVDVAGLLERHYRNCQDIEFTVERGKLFLLQTRSAKHTARAAIKMAVDMVDEGLIDKREALSRVEPEQMYHLLLPRLAGDAKRQAKQDGRVVTVGLGASPGGATGRVVFSPDEAAELGGKGAGVILVRPETRAEDVHGMLAAAGILTGRGGATSHAAVVARGLGKPCVAGAQGIEVNPEEGYFRTNETTVKSGEEISIDGSTGEVFLGRIATIQPSVADETEMATLLGWADDVRRLGVHANADNPRDAAMAIELGADGIGLCRTEHMFFEPERLEVVQGMILAAYASNQRPEDTEARERYQSALDELESHQTSDFEALFRVMESRPLVIRLLDPPLHEFLPAYDELFAEVTELRVGADDPALLAQKESLLASVAEMREVNPMLGLRGSRLGVIFPGIYRMQTRAIVMAVARVVRDGVGPRPQIMVPLVAGGSEMRHLRELLDQAIRETRKGLAISVDFKIGTMIEVPRAALIADEIAEAAEFFSFGTNDLTQTTFSFSRDDAEGKFLGQYVERNILPEDPFQVIDRKGVGKLIEIAVKLGRQTRADIELGICGEHGGDPSSIEFFHDAGLDYVSCSPFRVPVARLAAAQAALRDVQPPAVTS